MKFHCRSNNGELDFGDEMNRQEFKDYLKRNHGVKLEICPRVPESREQRAFYHGAVLRLWAYLDGKNYRSGKVIKSIHKIASDEFNGEVFVLNKKSYIVGKSTKGILNRGYVDRVIEYLEKEYAIKRDLVLDPEHYKDFRDRVYGNGEFDDYVSYLKHLNRI